MKVLFFIKQGSLLNQWSVNALDPAGLLESLLAYYLSFSIRKTVFELSAICYGVVVVEDCSFSLPFVLEVRATVLCSVLGSIEAFTMFIAIIKISLIYSFWLFQGSYIIKDLPLPWKLLLELKLPVY